MNDLNMYYAFRHELETFSLLQYAGNGPWSTTIMQTQNIDRSHSAVAFRIPYYETERVWVIEAIEKGLVLRSLSTSLARYNGKVYAYPVNPDQKIYTREAALWLLERVDKPESEYDWLGCISHWRTIFGLPPREAQDGRLWCTEAIFLALRDGARHPDYQHSEWAPRPGQEMLNMGFWVESLGRRIL